MGDCSQAITSGPTPLSSTTNSGRSTASPPKTPRGCPAGLRSSRCSTLASDRELYESCHVLTWWRYGTRCGCFTEEVSVTFKQTSEQNCSSNSLVPDGDVVLVPPEADLQIMVVGDDLQKVVLEDLRLPRGHAVDVSVVDLTCGTKQGLPAGDWVCAHLLQYQRRSVLRSIPAHNVNYIPLDGWR